jgi:hypothetical protein
MNLSKLFESKVGIAMISILLGLGVAAMFRSVCKEGKCIIVNGPPKEDVDKYYYKIQDTCYKYTPVAAECDSAKS